MKRNIYSITLILFLFIFVAACGQEQGQEPESRAKMMRTTNSAIEKSGEDQTFISAEIKKDVLVFDGIYDAVVLKGKEQVLVAYKVKQMQRFRMRDLEKQLKERLKKDFPDEKFVISSDYKIFLEAKKLQDKISDPQYDEKKAEERLQKIIKLKKELT
ncbi:sporulation protein [Bacillaceae bacterium Marseille-Q3522]|nr:sporulation protein [Bacillaceae bacterium Marseille-Q3522]